MKIINIINIQPELCSTCLSDYKLNNLKCNKVLYIFYSDINSVVCFLRQNLIIQTLLAWNSLCR